MENSKYDINELKKIVAKAIEDSSNRRYVFKPVDPNKKIITLEELKDIGTISEEEYNNFLNWLTVPIQTFEINIKAPKEGKE